VGQVGHRARQLLASRRLLSGTQAIRSQR
jgi:hypothetical protein